MSDATDRLGDAEARIAELEDRYDRLCRLIAAAGEYADVPILKTAADPVRRLSVVR